MEGLILKIKQNQYKVDFEDNAFVALRITSGEG
jgi:hypothetical protein